MPHALLPASKTPHLLPATQLRGGAGHLDQDLEQRRVGHWDQPLALQQHILQQEFVRWLAQHWRWQLRSPADDAVEQLAAALRQVCCCWLHCCASAKHQVNLVLCKQQQAVCLLGGRRPGVLKHPDHLPASIHPQKPVTTSTAAVVADWLRDLQSCSVPLGMQ
jgi:hypothetical protein